MGIAYSPTQQLSKTAATNANQGSFDIGATPGTALALVLPRSPRHLTQTQRSVSAIFVVFHGCRSRQTDVIAKIDSATFALGLDHIHQNRTEPS